MTSFSRVVAMLLVALTVGVWGCAQQPSGSGTGSGRIRDLETRNAKLDEDCRAALAESGAHKKKLQDLQAQHSQLQQSQESLTKERDQLAKEREEMQQRVTTTVGERDAMQSQLVRFGKELQQLVSKVDQAVASTKNNTPINTVSLQTTK